MPTPSIYAKFDRPLDSNQEQALIECVRAGMKAEEACWMMKFHPGRMVQHLKKDAEFYAAFKAAEEEGAQINKFELYVVLLENGRKSRIAARLAGLAGYQIVQMRKENDEFDLRVREADAIAHEALETEAYRRAVDGSDTLLIFMLKAGDPAKYRETQRHVDEDKEPPTDAIEKFEHAQRIVFALRLAASGEAAGHRPGNEQDHRKSPVDPAGGPAD